MENTIRNVGSEGFGSKQEDYRIIDDLTGFDNLKAMLEPEDIIMRREGTLKTKKKKRKKKRKNYGYFQFLAQEDMPVGNDAINREEASKDGVVQTDEVPKTESVQIPKKMHQRLFVNVAKAKEQEATVVEGSKALTVDCMVNSAGLKISCSGTAEMVQVESSVSATKETEQKRTEKENVDTVVEMTQASATINRVNSSIAIGVSSSSLEGDIRFCRGVAETVPAETIVNEMKKKRKVDRASEEMQADTAKGMEREPVEITGNIVLRQLLRIPRYFDGPSYNSWEMCSNCGQGHMACQCTMRKWKRKKLCFLCGSLDHVGKRCRKNRYCSVCKGRGHQAKYCPERDQERSSLGICLRCGNSGHDMFSCTTDYSPSDLKEIQCYVCKSFGHLCCVDFPDIDPREVSCHNCGESGHLGSSCGATGSTKAYTTCYKCGEEGHFAENCSEHGKGGLGREQVSY